MSSALLHAWHAGDDSLAAIAGPMLEPVTCVDLQGRFLYANDAALRALDLFGGPPVNGRPLRELCEGSDAARTEAHDREVMDCGDASVREERFVAAGYAHHWQVTRLPLRDPDDGSVCGLLSLWVEHRAHAGAEPADAAAPADGAPAEDELRANAERFRHLVETLGDVYWILDYRRMRRLYVSPACERLWGLRARELYVGSGYWLEHVYREDREHVETALAELAQGRDFVCEYRLVRGNGSLGWVRDRAVPVFGDDGAVDRVIGVCEDISEQRDLLSGMLERERRLDLAIGASGLHVWTFDASAHRLTVAPALCDLTGLGVRQCTLPGAWRRCVHADDRVSLDRAFRRCLEGGKDLDIDFRVLAPNRRGEHWLSVRATCIDGEGRHGRHLYGVAADVTARKRAQRERERLLAGERSARERAEAASRARDQFLSIVSHELRSPLSAIQSWTSVLEAQLREEATPVARRALGGIRSGVDQQVRLIEDLLDATRILSGRLGLAVSLVRLAPVVEAAIARVQDAATARAVVIDAQLEREHDGVQGDAQRLEQIVWHLLSNAIKFSPSAGQVQVRLEREGSTVRLRVSDQGKGIDPAFLPRLFDWFQREDISSQRRQEGLGLGLALVRHLTELQGGNVAASSPGPGQGAVFEVRLPLAAAAAAVRAPAPEVSSSATRPGGPEAPAALPLSGVHVMLVDDKAEAREALGALLTGMDAEVSTFASGSDALDWLRRRGADHRVDVLLCDLAMPVQDGFATLLRLRALEDELGIAHERRLPAIAVTAFAQHEDRQRALDAGFALHLAKPVSPEQLATAIGGELTQRAAARATMTTTRR